jgi:hypothetical protein
MQNASSSLVAVAAVLVACLAGCSVTTNTPGEPAGDVQSPTTASGGGTCPQGGCHQECPAGATCDATCAGGGCAQICAAGARCTFTCSGGRCSQDCGPSASCSFTCSGNGCAAH